MRWISATVTPWSLRLKGAVIVLFSFFYFREPQREPSDNNLVVRVRRKDQCRGLVNRNGRPFGRDKPPLAEDLSRGQRPCKAVSQSSVGIIRCHRFSCSCRLPALSWFRIAVEGCFPTPFFANLLTRPRRTGGYVKNRTAKQKTVLVLISFRRKFVRQTAPRRESTLEQKNESLCGVVVTGRFLFLPLPSLNILFNRHMPRSRVTCILQFGVRVIALWHNPMKVFSSGYEDKTNDKNEKR